MENPYWHAKYKPHLVDRREIRLLCFEIGCIVSASRAGQGTGIECESDEILETSLLDRLCFRMAENELSRRLLKLALLVRTYDDTMSRSEAATEYNAIRQTIDREHGTFGAVFVGSDDLTGSIRECSNKIIHAEDIRPTYETEDDRHDPHAKWGMTGDLELEGANRGKGWKISIYLEIYLEGVLHLVTFDERDAPGNDPTPAV